MIALLAVFAALLLISVAVSWRSTRRKIENFRVVERNRHPRLP